MLGQEAMRHLVAVGPETAARRHACLAAQAGVNIDLGPTLAEQFEIGAVEEQRCFRLGQLRSCRAERRSGVVGCTFVPIRSREFPSSCSGARGMRSLGDGHCRHCLRGIDPRALRHAAGPVDFRVFRGRSCMSRCSAAAAADTGDGSRHGCCYTCARSAGPGRYGHHGHGPQSDDARSRCRRWHCAAHPMAASQCDVAWMRSATRRRAGAGPAAPTPTRSARRSSSARS